MLMSAAADTDKFEIFQEKGRGMLFGISLLKCN
jgi:hypothetical protein